MDLIRRPHRLQRCAGEDPVDWLPAAKEERGRSMHRGKGCRGAREWEGRDGEWNKRGERCAPAIHNSFDRRGEDLAGGLETNQFDG